MEDKPSEKHRLGKRVFASTALPLSNSERALAASSSDAGQKKCKMTKHHTSKNSILEKRTKPRKSCTERSDGQVEVAVSQAFRDIVNTDDVSPGDIELPEPQPTTTDFIQDLFNDRNPDALRSEEDLPPRDATDDDGDISHGAASDLPNVGSLSDIELTVPEADPVSTTEDQDFLKIGTLMLYGARKIFHPGTPSMMTVTYLMMPLLVCQMPVLCQTLS